MKIEIDENVYAKLAERVMQSNKSPSDVLNDLLSAPLASVQVSGSKTIPQDYDLENLIQTEDYKAASAVSKYLRIFSWLYKNRREDFQKVLGYSSGKRIYFASDPDEIIKSGKSMRAERIPSSEHFLFAGIDNKGKRRIVAEVLHRIFDYSHDISVRVANSIQDSGIKRVHIHDLSSYE